MDTRGTNDAKPLWSEESTAQAWLLLRQNVDSVAAVSADRKWETGYYYGVINAAVRGIVPRYGGRKLQLGKKERESR